MIRRRAAAALIAATVAGCSGGTAATTVQPTAFSALGDYYHQQVSWRGCTVATGRMQCATVRVPTDYAHPGAGTTAVHLGRVASSGDARGPLLMNPGGPGASGIEFVGLFANAVPRLRALQRHGLGEQPHRALGCGVTCQAGRTAQARDR